MEQSKDFDTLNVNELLENGKKLLNEEDYIKFDSLMFQLAREYFDSHRLISCDLLAHIKHQLILGDYTDINPNDIRIVFHIQDEKYMTVRIYLYTETKTNYYVTSLYDIKREHFKGEYSRISKPKYYTFKQLYNNQF